jgi:hypothetical protein
VEFQITRKNKIEAWRFIRLAIILYVVVIGWSLFYPFRWFALIGLSIFLIFIETGPGIYLYFEYVKYNKNCLLTLDILHNCITYRMSNGELIMSQLDNITRISVYIPPNNYRDSGSFTSMEDFSYSRFELKDGREFYITCLMISQLKLKDFVQNYFSSVPIKFHPWWIFPSIRLCNFFRRKDV